MIPKEDLRQIICMEKLSDPMLDKIIPEMNLLKLREKEIVFDEGNEALKFYMLLRGKILLEKKISPEISVSLGAIKPGHAFGWSSIFGEPYSFMALCAEDSEIFMVNADTLVKLMDEDQSLGYVVMDSLTRVMKNRLDRVSEQFLKAIREHPDIASILD